MNKHTAICPNGQVVKRNSQNRTYSHVAVVHNIQNNTYKVLGWSSTLDLARTNVQSLKSKIENLIKWDCYTGVYGDKPECLILDAIIA
jgi:hypothetical protein